MTQAAIEALADDAWLIRLGETMHPTVNAGVHRLAASIRQAAPEWLRGLSPAYASLGVYFDPERASPDDVRAWLAKAIGAADAGSTARTDDHNDHDCVRIVEIPVAYGEDFGADFVSAARTLDLPAQALIERHCAPLYQVAMIGFAPGFPYLLGLDPTLTLPHPRAWQRAFVLVPWAQVDCDARLAGPHGGKVAELARNTPDAHSVEVVCDDWMVAQADNLGNPDTQGDR